ncbi:hypothetical protein [Candidatus Ichthyocystis sparus]|uniref:hypothetical protein n=1 Tax=Candidatus Ichthyocystis sparus TaxID=1561004 RepID=UPI000B8A329C|nr:hypothetical protein [Candidatus Ichthyocystis sparus]
MKAKFIRMTSFDGGPYTLSQLATAAIYGLSCRESVDLLVPFSSNSRPFREAVNNLVYHDSLAAHFPGEGGEGKVYNLVQLSPNEAIDAATASNDKSLGKYRTKYEYDSTSSDNVRCSDNYSHDYYETCCNDHYRLLSNCDEISTVMFLRSNIGQIIQEFSVDWNLEYSFSSEDSSVFSIHPMYQVVNAKNTDDIIENYYEIRHDILSLPSKPLSGNKKSSPPSPEEILYYRDPLYFLGSKLALCDFDTRPCFFVREFILHPLRHSLLLLCVRINKLIDYLEDSSGKIDRKLHNLILSLLLQIKYSSLLLRQIIRVRFDVVENGLICEPPERERLIIPSLKVVVCLRNYIKYLKRLGDIFMPFLGFSNFVSLEDMMRISEIMFLGSRNQHHRSIYKREVRNISLLLSLKYPDIIESKKMIISCLLEKVNVRRKVLSLLEIQCTDTTFDCKNIIEVMLLRRAISDGKEDGSDSKDRSVGYINNLIKEILEMKSFLRSLPE